MFADVSAPAILQWFDSSYATVENRAADIFKAGYGAVWLPPPGRADLSNFSVGYDVYDRFDLGKPGNPTLYGTETGLKSVAAGVHRAGVDLHLDFVLNHNGFANQGTAGFKQAGGYPGFFLDFFGDVDGDFNSAYAYGDVQGRLAGLIDIAHGKNYQAIRSPVPGFANNIAAGTAPLFGRLANLPDENNRRFYPDIGHNTISVFDPITGEQNIPVHQFNLENPLAGDPVPENALGYLMRNAQWMVQVIGADGLRLDAAKHVSGFVLDYIDRAVYRQNPRKLLDGSTKHVFSYSEVFDGSPGVLLPHVKKTINPFDPGRIGGNRDTLDFKLYFALKANLEHPGTSNAWYNIKDAALDVSDDGQHNGSAGVQFISNHDVFKPFDLADVAQAYVLMQPGNAIVYFNGKEFGDNRDFPKEGFGNALGGQFGTTITRLLEARNTHGRGNYAERWVDNQGTFVFERLSSAVVGLSNRGDNGYDTRSVEVGFAPGTHLMELSGNATDSFVDPFDDIKDVLTVYHDNGDNKNKIDIRIPRNRNANGDWTGKGYVIYGLATPQAGSGLQLTNIAQTLAGDLTAANNYENGINRLSNVYVIQQNSFQAKLQTSEVRLLGLDSLRDIYADGDNALLKVDDGVDVNHNGHVDLIAPDTVSYGFEQFGDKRSPLIGSQGVGGPRGDGEFIQTIDTTQLAEGYHYLTARAFRNRTDGGPAVFSDFKKVVYVDRLGAVSAVDSFNPITAGVSENRDLVIRSVDQTASRVHVFLNLPASLSDAQILAMTNPSNQAGKIDRDLFKYGFFNLKHGNNTVTIVTNEVSGRQNVQRVSGLFTSTIYGAGLGDVNFDGGYSPTDINLFGQLLSSGNTQFNPAADLNADGLIDNSDLFQLGSRLTSVGADQATMNAYNQLLGQVVGATVGNFIWNDGNANGIQDAGEPGLSQVTVRLYTPGGNGQIGGSDDVFVASTATNPNGSYNFTNLAPGSYFVQVAAPPDHVFSPRDQGASDSLDSDADPTTGNTAVFTLAASQIDNTRDAGLRNPPPTVDIVDVTPDPRTSPVDQITIVFSEPVNGFTQSDLTLASSGGGNLLTAAQPLTTTDNVTWTLGNLASVTATAGSYLLTLLAAGSGITDAAGQALLAGATDSFVVYATISGRRVFYNNSVFDGETTAAGAADDVAIATDKNALLPGQLAGVGNYTNYSRGINGVMIDIKGLALAPTLADFSFRTGNTNTPGAWATAPAPAGISVRGGPDGSSRVSLVWGDDAVQNAWLEVTVKATLSTGLAAADKFYFGNAVGESGNSPGDTQVNAADEIAARNNPATFVNPAPIGFPYDFNRDGFVNAADQIIARSNATPINGSLLLISPPAQLTADNLALAAVVPDDTALKFSVALLQNPTAPAGIQLFERQQAVTAVFPEPQESIDRRSLVEARPDSPPAPVRTDASYEPSLLDEELVDLLANDVLG